MTATALPERVHIFMSLDGSAVTTLCGTILELPPLRSLGDINVTTYPDDATCSECRHPSNHP